MDCISNWQSNNRAFTSTHTDPLSRVNFWGVEKNVLCRLSVRLNGRPFMLLAVLWSRMKSSAACRGCYKAIRFNALVTPHIKLFIVRLRPEFYTYNSHGGDSFCRSHIFTRHLGIACRSCLRAVYICYKPPDFNKPSLKKTIFHAKRLSRQSMHAVSQSRFTIGWTMHPNRICSTKNIFVSNKGHRDAFRKY